MKVIEIDVMYRDGNNYKNCEAELFTNKDNIPFEEIKKAIESLGEDGIMVQDYGINSIAPMDNEFLPSTGDDHSYCEITGVEESEHPTQPEKDIKTVLDLIKNEDAHEGPAQREVAAQNQAAYELDMPNGFTSWYETHHEVVATIHTEKPNSPVLKKIQLEEGRCGFYTLAKKLTDKFEKLNTGREWDGEFFEEVEKFLTKELED